MEKSSAKNFYTDAVWVHHAKFCFDLWFWGDFLDFFRLNGFDIRLYGVTASGEFGCDAVLCVPRLRNSFIRLSGTTNPDRPRRGEYLAEFIKGGGVLTCVRGGEHLIGEN